MLLSVHRFFFFYKQEIACHSLLLHYKGEGFTCDLSAREPLVHSGLENPGWSSALHPGFTHTALRFRTLCRLSHEGRLSVSTPPHTHTRLQRQAGALSFSLTIKAKMTLSLLEDQQYLERTRRHKPYQREWERAGGQMQCVCVCVQKKRALDTSGKDKLVGKPDMELAK